MDPCAYTEHTCASLHGSNNGSKPNNRHICIIGLRQCHHIKNAQNFFLHIVKCPCYYAEDSNERMLFRSKGNEYQRLAHFTTTSFVKLISSIKTQSFFSIGGGLATSNFFNDADVVKKKVKMFRCASKLCHYQFPMG